MLEALSATLSENTLISVGADLNLPSQFIKTMNARNWRGKNEWVKDRLVVFGIGV